MRYLLDNNVVSEFASDRIHPGLLEVRSASLPSGIARQPIGGMCRRACGRGMCGTRPIIGAASQDRLSELGADRRAQLAEADLRLLEIVRAETDLSAQVDLWDVLAYIGFTP